MVNPSAAAQESGPTNTANPQVTWQELARLCDEREGAGILIATPTHFPLQLQGTDQVSLNRGDAPGSVKLRRDQPRAPVITSIELKQDGT